MAMLRGDYKRGDSTALKAGFSTLLDKTMDMQLLVAKKNLKISMTVFWKQKVNLQKKETNKMTITTIITATIQTTT